MRARPRYTIGQRSGLGVALGERQYVAAIDVPANLIRLGRREDLQRETLSVGDVSFVDRAPDGPFRARVRIRHRAPLVPALVSPPDGAAVSAANQAADGRWRVELEEPAWAPAPGQAAVFYGDRTMPSSVVAASRRLPERQGADGASMDAGLATFVLQPAFVLSLLVGAFHTCVYVFVRGKLGWHVPLVLVGCHPGCPGGPGHRGPHRRRPEPRRLSLAVGVRPVLAGHRHRGRQQRADLAPAGAAGTGRQHPSPPGLTGAHDRPARGPDRAELAAWPSGSVEPISAPPSLVAARAG